MLSIATPLVFMRSVSSTISSLVSCRFAPVSMSTQMVVAVATFTTKMLVALSLTNWVDPNLDSNLGSSELLSLSPLLCQDRATSLDNYIGTYANVVLNGSTTRHLSSSP
ncbi:hypothetical protein BHE74_00045538 [Ensete ventricosum]|nr:hypothetical protein BHE74_00045538 [Ensete ventricosum]